MATKTRSLRGNFYLTVVITISIVCGIFGYVDYKMSEGRMMAELNLQSKLSVGRLALNLRVPLWNISPGLVTTVVDSELKGPSAALITILDEDEKTIVTSRFKNSSGTIVDASNVNTSHYILASQKIYHKKDLVGEAKVYFTDQTVREELRKGLLNTLVLTVLLIVILCLILGFSLNRLVINPIIYLSDVASKMAKGDLKQTIEVEGKGELASLSANLKKMQLSFKVAIKRLRAASKANQ